MTIRIIKGAKVGLWYRTDVRLMMFYTEADGDDILLVALMPMACKATCQENFDVVDGTAICKLDCTTCQFAKTLKPMSFDELAEHHGILFPTKPPPLKPLTADAIWSRVKFPPPASVQVLLDQP